MKILVFLLIFVQCALIKNEIWTGYSIRYIGSEVELNKFISEITANQYRYKIITYADQGFFEVQYKKIKGK
jgi:hypothetical protein